MRLRILYTLAFLFATMQTFAQTYTYDKLNRLTKVVYDNGTTITYTFDALGNRITKKVTGATSTTYTVTVAVTPSGSGTVTGGGTYGKGTLVELNAIPNAGYEFSKWSDGVTDNPRSVNVTNNMSYTALFKESTVIPDLLGDIVVDGKVNQLDLNALVDAYITNTQVTQITDLDTDGSLTIADISYLIAIINENNGGNDNGSIYMNHEYVDLGLPSGTLWATCNLGASSPEEVGCHYAWGETTGDCDGKNNFDWKTYKYNNFDPVEYEGSLGDRLTKYNYDSDFGYNGYTDELIVLEAVDDAATANWGGQWRMPTRSEVVELFNKKYMTWVFTTLNGVQGFVGTSLIEGYTDKSVFFPAVGGEYIGTSITSDDYAAYWTSSLKTWDLSQHANLFEMRAYDGKRGEGSNNRCRGLSIRPVVSVDAIVK